MKISWDVIKIVFDLMSKSIYNNSAQSLFLTHGWSFDTEKDNTLTIVTVYLKGVWISPNSMEQHCCIYIALIKLLFSWQKVLLCWGVPTQWFWIRLRIIEKFHKLHSLCCVSNSCTSFAQRLRVYLLSAYFVTLTQPYCWTCVARGKRTWTFVKHDSRLRCGSRGAPGVRAPPLDPRFWGPKIEHFWSLFNFSIIFFASLCSAYISLICCFFKVQIQKFSSLTSLSIWFLT